MNKTILVGNDINNINNSTSWNNLLNEIIKTCGNNNSISKDKPFPILYEEIFLKGVKKNNIDEYYLKTEIAKIVDKIEPNEIHEELIKLNVTNYITTNYDYVLEKVLIGDKPTHEIKNNGIIKETKYSVFRHNNTNRKKFWHIHGENNIPNSITLGFEHYGGQLQQFRNYTVTGTNYKNKKLNSNSLHRRIRENDLNNQSWIDLMFLDEIHILGLGLGFEETDIWWLLTNRVRFQNERTGNRKNRIIYYSPSECKTQSKEDIMRAYDIELKYINEKDKLSYYKKAIKIIANGL
ncbi:SIR2 family protein [Anaerophaga thermohalophila]|uniref:SIR2 family protein n=1 Tax=Anaerophaga thermohalophila TaxID=177400 RepID=UPI000311DBD6|nr:SIR2 family protein [Anaerophaga thermohalophila]